MNTPTDNPYIDTASAKATVFTVPNMVEADDNHLRALAGTMAQQLGRLRFQVFVRILEANWFDDVDNITLAWEWEQENRVPVPRAFGDRSQSNMDFEAIISTHFVTNDEFFAELINEHFEDGNIEFSKSDLAPLVRAVVPKDTLAQLDALQLDQALPESRQTPKNRL